ncbi:hypothetical protein N7494_009262 [Penicillium frequentans]|uniref:CCHC-type domain-containing protein n=1 Tax=Penicillium frequentans TaxID=3151616 RepID=A0AAD6CQ24_9EURO|nr:hypothetical protein N7494_009262 [Penicillium glabrum]
MSDTWDDNAAEGASWDPDKKEDGTRWGRKPEVGYDHASSPTGDQGFGGGHDGNACRICGGSDHFARNCPNEVPDYSSYPQQSRGCFNCGQEGHSKAECTEPPKSFSACFNCGEEGHSKADCTQPRKFSGACFNCGEEGHSKTECTNPRVFKGTCRLCEKEGHPASECPERPPDVCRNCGAEGHQAFVCTAPRKFDLNKVADRLPEEAWDMMKAAGTDTEAFRSALQVYSKAAPEATYVEIENKMREDNFPLYTIAVDKEVGDMHTLIDLQGNLDKKYTVAFYRGPNSPRNILNDRWPDSPEDNIERLANAGVSCNRYVVKCRNCDEIGHIAKNCKQERTEAERTEIKCSNCEAVGHRVRDCPEPRRSKHGCRNCGSDEHQAKECPEPRVAPLTLNAAVGHFAQDCPKGGDDRGPRTCRNCGSEDHIARECDKPRDPATIMCRNCDQLGHSSRECPQPKDWSKVQCNRCGEFGHTVHRCPQPEDSVDAGYNETAHDHNPEGQGSAAGSRPASAAGTTVPVADDDDLQDQAW